MKKLIILSLALLMASTACQDSEWLDEGDYFFFKNEGAIMPVWVQGNLDSDVMLINCHGGPGGGSTGHDFHISLGYKLLENDYAMVYWDQRSTGLSQGEAKLEDLTIQQHIDDLEKLVSIIRAKYNPKSLFILGFSWGGALTGGYLGQKNHDDLFKGWIDLDGSIQDKFEGEAKKEWIFDRIDDYYHKDPEFYQYIIDWYRDNPNPVESDWEPYTFAGAMNAYAYDWDKTQEHSPIPYMELILSSPFSLSYYFTQYFDIRWLNGYDVTKEVANIEIPTLFLWGKEDGAVPPSTAQFAYDIIGTQKADKEIILIEECAHGPHFDQPHEFYKHCSAFIERYK